MWRLPVTVLTGVLVVAGCTAPTGTARTTSPETLMSTPTAPISPPITTVASATTPAPVAITGSVADHTDGFPPSGVVQTTIYDSTGSSPVFEIGWDSVGKYLVVILRGSSSCHVEITRVIKTGDQAISIVTSPPPPADKACTADLSAFTADVVVPPGILRTRPLQVHLFNHVTLIPAQALKHH